MITDFIVWFFISLKYTFVVILFLLGIFTLLKLRGIYFTMRLRENNVTTNVRTPLDKMRLLLGAFYIIFALGILFNYLTYLLYWVLDPLPDKILMDLLISTGVFEESQVERFFVVGVQINQFEEIFFCIITLLSFVAFLNVVLSIWVIVYQGRQAVRQALELLFSGLILGILLGFNTFMPLFMI